MCTFLSLDVLLKFVRHLSPPFPSLMIPAEPLWGTASVVRLAFTFPAPGILGYASGDYEAHHSKSSCGSFSLSLSVSCFLSLSSPIGFLSSFLLLLYFCIRRHSPSHSSSSPLFLPSRCLPSSFALIFFDLVRMISSVEGGEKNARTGEGRNLFINLFIVSEIKRFFFPFLPPLCSCPPLPPLSSWLRQMNV